VAPEQRNYPHPGHILWTLPPTLDPLEINENTFVLITFAYLETIWHPLGRLQRDNGVSRKFKEGSASSRNAQEVSKSPPERPQESPEDAQEYPKGAQESLEKHPEYLNNI